MLGDKMLESYFLDEIDNLRLVARHHGLKRLDEMLLDAALTACSELHDQRQGPRLATVCADA
jgi:hypothetical protein